MNIDDGSELWRFESDAAFQSSAAVGDALYIADNNGQLYALNPADGSEIWSTQIGQASYTASPVVTADRVYMGDPETGGVVGINKETAEEEWTFDTPSGILSSPAIVDNTLYCGTETGTVYAVGIADESPRWEFSADGEVTGAPVVKNGDVYVTTAAGSVHAITAETGDERWTTNTDQSIRSSPAVDDTSLYVGDGELFESPGRVYSLSTDSGEIEWRFRTEGSYGGRQGAIIQSPTVGQERVYFGVDSNKLYAVNKEDGTEVWRFDTSVVLSSPAIYEGVLYTGIDSDAVLALE
ncbi:PQQ-binding-like beta-propeller repeat protein [Halovenus salina]|uniref:PQQ-binding-like beta-propeller repeat protein n=1 Tax=Halovenus salina TaxID=1510225 RepID=A0ABD5W5F2_9EURY